jgi:hypothetical protein
MTGAPFLGNAFPDPSQERRVMGAWERFVGGGGDATTRVC